jgi:O-antigen ligase
VEGRECSHPLLLRAVWFLVIALAVRQTVFLRQRDRVEFMTLDTFALLEIGIITVLGLVLVASPVVRSLLVTTGRAPAAWFLAIYALGVVSALWSAIPAYSAFRAAEALIAAAGVLMISGLAGSLGSAVKQWLVTAGLLFILSGALIIRLYGFTLQLSAWHTNSYSAIGAMVAAYCLTELGAGHPDHRRWLIFGMAGGLFVVVLGTSTASNLSVAAGILVGAILNRSGKIALGASLLFVLGMLLGVEGEDAVQVMLAGKSTDQMMTLRGRTHLWEFYLDQFWQSPWIGTGFATAARLGERYTTNTHNALLSIATGLGTSGLALFAFWLIRLAGELVRPALRGVAGARGIAAGLAAGLVNAMSCAYLGEGWSIATVTFVGLLGIHHFHLRLESAQEIDLNLADVSSRGVHQRSLPVRRMGSLGQARS